MSTDPRFAARSACNQDNTAAQRYSSLPFHSSNPDQKSWRHRRAASLSHNHRNGSAKQHASHIWPDLVSIIMMPSMSATSHVLTCNCAFSTRDGVLVVSAREREPDLLRAGDRRA